MEETPTGGGSPRLEASQQPEQRQKGALSQPSERSVSPAEFGEHALHHRGRSRDGLPLRHSLDAHRCPATSGAIPVAPSLPPLPLSA